MEQTKLDDKKKRLIIIASVLVVFIGITLAYVVGQISDGAIGKVNVTADTTDNLQFSVDKDISLNPTQFNVPEGGGGLSDTAVGTATLLANSTNKTATYDYYVYFLINTNEYIYTTEDYKPEIVLTITDPEGNLVTELANSDLEYVEAENADGTITKGFDITTASGLINIASLYEITSSSSTDATVQDWTFTVTFINLTTNQSANGGSTLDAEIILSKEATNYHEICEPGTMACDIARLYNEENPESNGLYYHNGDITVDVCMYSGKQIYNIDMIPSTSAIDCENVFYYAGFYYDNTIADDIDYNEIITVAEQVFWDSEDGICKIASGEQVYGMDPYSGLFYELSQDFCKGYADIDSDGTAMLIFSELGRGNMEKKITDAEDKSYRYSGSNPNNYVCFGSIDENCLNDNLYRIIGVFNGQVKLIKADYVTSNMLGTNSRDYYGPHMYYNNDYKGNMDINIIARYSWNNDTSVSEDGSNNWSTSELNTINLNINYWNYLGELWQNLIAKTAWRIGGTSLYANIAKEFNEAETNTTKYNDNSSIYTDEIGLMYINDYGYAASPDAWLRFLTDYNDSTILSNNWMHMGLSEWTITPAMPSASTVLSIYDHGSLGWNVAAHYTYSVRPTFYLKSNTELAGGTGSLNDPYRLMV